jgi:hypothetical protein
MQKLEKGAASQLLMTTHYRMCFRKFLNKSNSNAVRLSPFTLSLPAGSRGLLLAQPERMGLI